MYAEKLKSDIRDCKTRSVVLGLMCNPLKSNRQGVDRFAASTNPAAPAGPAAATAPAAPAPRAAQN